MPTVLDSRLSVKTLQEINSINRKDHSNYLRSISPSQVNLRTENTGCSFEDMVDITTFHTKPQHQFGTIMKVKQTIFGAPPCPNWTAVGVTWLSGFDFELKVIARIPG